MVDYSEGKIYKIKCYTTKQIYIGSTSDTLEQRLIYHECNYRGWLKKKDTQHWRSVFTVLKENNYKMKLIEDYPCSSKYELEKREGKYQVKYDCVNKNVAGHRHRSIRDKEYREKNKEILSQKQKEKITCTLCGTENISRSNKSQHEKTDKCAKLRLTYSSYTY